MFRIEVTGPNGIGVGREENSPGQEGHHLTIICRTTGIIVQAVLDSDQLAVLHHWTQPDCPPLPKTPPIEIARALPVDFRGNGA